MQNLERAITVTHQIREALEGEVGRARAERGLIRTMDIDGLTRRAALRAEFNATIQQLQGRLSAELAGVAQTLGITEVTVDGLRQAAPAQGERLSESLAAIRALAGALAELDDLNRLLGQRALSYVRAYMGAVNPTPAAYDRRGSTATGRMSTTISRVI
jgi:hypothetical protein